MLCEFVFVCFFLDRSLDLRLRATHRHDAYFHLLFCCGVGAAVCETRREEEEKNENCTQVIIRWCVLLWWLNWTEQIPMRAFFSLFSFFFFHSRSCFAASLPLFVQAKLYLFEIHLCGKFTEFDTHATLAYVLLSSFLHICVLRRRAVLFCSGGGRVAFRCVNYYTATQLSYGRMSARARSHSHPV